MLANITANAHSINLATKLNDSDLVRLLIHAVENGLTPFVRRSERNANRTLRIPDALVDQWQCARLAIPRGYTFGDVLDRLSSAPLLTSDKEKTTAIVKITPQTREDLRELFHSRGVGAKTVVAAVLEQSDLAPPVDGLVSDYAIAMTKAQREALRSRAWPPAVEAAHFAAAVREVSARSQPRRNRTPDRSRCALLRGTVDKLRGLTHVMRLRREQAIVCGAEGIAELPPAPIGRTVQVRFVWGPGDLEALRRFEGHDTAAIVTAAVDWLAKDQLDAVEAAALAFPQCWPRGAARLPPR